MASGRGGARPASVLGSRAARGVEASGARSPAAAGLMFARSLRDENEREEKEEYPVGGDKREIVRNKK